jgi:GDP-mannose 6-dehydrogenase
MPTLRSILPSNRQHAERAFDLIQRHAPRRIALFGLSFKPGTGDVRESPYVALALRLLRHGSELAVFDQSLASVHDRELDGAGMRTLARRRVDDPAACLDGADTIVIGHACPPAVDVIAARHAGRPIVDLQGVPALRTIPGVRYEGLCW